MAENNDKNKDIIELSDMAIGTSREDEQIIELTEDLVAEARDAITGAVLEGGDKASDIIELDQPIAEPLDTTEISVSDEQFEAALERVVEKKYGERIEALIDEVIRKKITEDIEAIKDLILKRGGGK